MAPLTMWEEKNTGSNLPAQIELYATDGGAYKFLFMAKGGGSANKSFLYQETKAVLNEASMMKFLEEKIRSLGTAACPPYHLAIVVGGTSAEFALKTAKYASAHYLDDMPSEGSPLGHGFRDKELEEKVFELTQKIGIGAQFGGKYFCHDVRVVRLPRHGASCPVAIAVSCSADRQAVAKITAEGVFLEQLETDPARFLPETTDEHLDESSDVVKIDLNQPMDTILAELTKYPVKTRLSLTGPLVVARDIAHAKIKERLDAGEEMPQYLKDHPVYYAGPAKTPEGYASGSFGPTTAGRMDSYVAQFQAAGGSKVMLAKGNRSKQVTDACEAHGGFYLAPSAARPPVSPRTASRRWRSWSTRSWAWSRLEDRGRGLPGVHRRGRQGQRLLPGPGPAADVHVDPGARSGPRLTHRAVGRPYCSGRPNPRNNAASRTAVPGMSEYRIEHDSMGEVRVPAHAKWRAQTQRAVENFPVSGQHIERAHIEALARIKGAAAKVNAELGVLDEDVARAIQEAAEEVARGTGTSTSPSTSSRPVRAPRPT